MIRRSRAIRAVVAALGPLASGLREARVEIHLETVLGPRDFAALLVLLPADVFKVNYDSGNSASLGYAPRAQFAAYGERVTSIHIKDRQRGGGTVPLGAGDADFDALFADLVWGAGLHAQRLLGMGVLEAERVRAFVDSDQAVQGSMLAGKPIVAAKEIPNIAGELSILISSWKAQEAIGRHRQDGAAQPRHADVLRPVERRRRGPSV